MRRHQLAVGLVIVAVGCSGGGTTPTSLQGSFMQIEGAVDDLHQNVFADDFVSGGDLGDDRLGLAVDSFSKAAAGSRLAADAEELSKKVHALGELAVTKPPVEKLREAVEDLQSTVATIKSKL